MRSVFALLAVLVLAAASVRAADPLPPRSVTVSGESAIFVTPDEVLLSIGVETFDPSLEAARQQNDQHSRRLLAAIKDLGVEEKHLQTDDLRVEIRYRSGEPFRGVEGYVARREYTITLKDPKLTERAVDAALRSGANLLLGIEYRTDELRKHRDEARRMATRAAREKAQLLAGELGEQVGRPRAISEAGFFFGGWSPRGYRGAMMTQNSFQMQDGGAGIEGQTIPIGQIAIRATVNVTFDLAEPQ
jgi:uncharacterized protein YggE